MKRGKRLLAAGLTLALCLTMLCALPVRAVEVTFTAVNDSVLKLSADTMPIWSDGVLYTPYTTFDAAYNGVNWDIECIYTKGGNMVTVMDLERRKFLEFNLREGSCCDGLTGEQFEPGAIIRNGQPYLPVRTVCAFFELSYSYREIDQGSLLRIKNEDVVLNDRIFVEAAVNVLELRLQAYHQSQNAGTAQEPDVNVTVPSAPEREDELSVATYLALRCEREEEIPALLSVLEGRGVKALFLVTPEIARQRGDLIVWMLGSGHSVGLLAQGETLEQTRRILEEGSRVLEEQAFVRTTVAGVPAEYLETLEQEGWVCWNATLELTPGDNDGPGYFARRTISRLDGRTRSTYLSLDAGENTLRILPTLLARLEEAGYDLAVPLETRL